MLNIKKYLWNKNKKSNHGYRIIGANNKIIIVEEDGTEQELLSGNMIPGLEILIYGSNNVIKIHKPFNSINSTIQIGNFPEIHNDGAYIEINSTPAFAGNKILAAYGRNQKLYIGSGTTMRFARIVMPESSDIYIGNDCMFANDVTIHGADGHTIFDINTGEICNAVVHQVRINNHCWLGSSCLILKGAVIPKNSIVAARSTVTKSFEVEDNVLIAGLPAVIKKRGINWSIKSPSYYIDNSLSPLEEMSC